ncbi:MAG: cbb3-type cytochrome c oxidase subunit I [Proteobacteria bacterium]|nr:cbb3-type cytochrome c oxidase subunit I [Pseudomonadota bacterium]
MKETCNTLSDVTTGDATAKRLIYGWLLLSVVSLGCAGLFAFLIALARTPVVGELLPLGRDYIYVGLVGHVVLAFVIWFLAFEGFLLVYTSTLCTGRALFCKTSGFVALGLSSVGVALVVVSAAFALGPAVLANYVPVLQSPVFFVGMLLFGLGMVITVLNTFATLLFKRPEKRPERPLEAAGEITGVDQKGGLPTATFGMVIGGFGILVAVLCFALSGYMQYSTGKAVIDYERLFWGGGHVLQFTNTIAMVTAWLLLSVVAIKGAASRYEVPAGESGEEVSDEAGFETKPSRPLKVLYALFLLSIVPSPVIYFFYDTASAAYKDSFTLMMQFGHVVSVVLFVLIIASKMLGARVWQSKGPAWSAALLSMALFLVGGIIGAKISGVNTIIPAHYHSVIGAITISFMGLFFVVAPRIGRPLRCVKLARITPYVYFLGVLCFAIGLYIAGAHGSARKTYGTEQDLAQTGRYIGMAIMGVGGLVSVTGGVLFVVNALATLLGRSSSKGSGR